ncbi:MAG TPA: shikimate dehydrogenase [Polyangiaceae bacterium]
MGQQLRAAIVSKLGAAALAKPPRYLVGLIGRGIGSSRSPAMHEREGARMGLSYGYVLIDFDRLGLTDADLGEVIAEAQAFGFAGLNITHPFKQAVVAYLDDLAPEAAAIGAVNTVIFSARRVGHNTDSWGFAESFREGLPHVAIDSVVQFGAGGGGAAVAHALLANNVGELQIYDIDAGRANVLAQRLAERHGNRVTAARTVREAMARANGVVNTTPIGMDKYPGVPLPRELLEPRHWVADIVYFPPDTELLQLARSLGCRTMAGTGMAVYQAVKAFELFTGLAPDRACMVDHFKAAA